MMNSSMNFIKGMAFGLTTAVAVTMVAKGAQGKKKKFKKTASKAVEAVGDIVENVQCLMK